MPALRLFEREDFLRAAGPALRPGGTSLTEAALVHCLLPEGAPVADVGCGRGASLALLAGKGFRAVGVDPSRALLAQARAMAPDCQLVCGEAEALPLADGAFAAVFCECVLTLAADPDAAVGEMRRILAPGGFLVLSDLYLRDPVDHACAHAPGCASGAQPREALESRILRAGLSLRVFVDHSRLLAELAGKLVFAGIPRESLGLCGASGGRPGYYLCIAQKEGDG